MADGRRHVVLQFERGASALNKSQLVMALRSQLADHSVFDSGGDGETEWISVVPVVRRQSVMNNASLFESAIADYGGLCTELVKAYRSGELGDEWLSHEHGDHCRFEHKGSGQVVEAPLDHAPEASLDPYFFWEFVASTPGHAAVAALIPGGYHDAARALEALAEQGAEER